MENEIDSLLNSLINYKDEKIIIKQKKRIKKHDNITDEVHDLNSLFEFLNTTKEQLLPYPNAITDFEKYLNACVLIPKIVKTYNEDTVLDWNNSNEYKYLPYMALFGSGWVLVGCNGYRSGAGGSIAHHYKSNELGIKGITNFKQTYLDFYTYKG